jgi:hypothetical protein
MVRSWRKRMMMPSNSSRGPWHGYMARAGGGGASHLTAPVAEPSPSNQPYGQGAPPPLGGREQHAVRVNRHPVSDAPNPHADCPNRVAVCLPHDAPFTFVRSMCRGGSWRGSLRERSRDHFVSCFLKCSRAAETASGPIDQDVFFASFGRAKFARRNARSRFGSTSNSDASSFGVITFAMCVTPFRSFDVIPVYYIGANERASVVSRSLRLQRSNDCTIERRNDRTNERLHTATIYPPLGGRDGGIVTTVTNGPQSQTPELF